LRITFCAARGTIACPLQERTEVQDLQRDDERWEQVRARYPVQEPLLNLNNAAVSPPARAVEQR
jgi:hypothetical protein